MSQPRRGLADSFQHPGVARSYRSRPPYPDEAIELLRTLVVGSPTRVIDLGAGDGSLARPLARHVDRVDAVELHPAMIHTGQLSAGGEASNLLWHTEPAEHFTTTGPFGLATAGASMHWFDLEQVCARLAPELRPGAPLALCDRTATHPVLEPLKSVIQRHSKAPEHDPSYDVGIDLQRRGLWTIEGTHTTDPVPFRQTVTEYLDALHSTASLARELMTSDELETFDTEVRAILQPLARADHLELTVTASIAWGNLRTSGS